jgi:hypothetical protein
MEAVADGPEEPAPAAALDDLIDSADSADGPVVLDFPRTVERPTTVLDVDLDFAAVLAAAASRPPRVTPPPAPSPRQAIDELVDDRIHRAETSANRHGSDAASTDERPVAPSKVRLGVLAALREVGVPVPLSPDASETSLYRAVEQVIQQLPAPPRPPRKAGDILALVGPLSESMKIASVLALELHIPQRSIWVVDPTDTGGHGQVISGPADAARHADTMCLRETPSIVVVDTAADDTLIDDDVSWCAQILAALSPQAVWAVIDASRKTGDVQAELDRLGPVDALAVYSVTKTSSPATVWDLDVPVALLDGRPASQGVWAALLFDVLGRPMGHIRVAAE